MLWTTPAMAWWWIPAVVWIGWYHVRSLSDFSPTQRWLSTICRGLVATLLILAMCGPVWTVQTIEQRLIVAIDRSESIDEAAGRQAEVRGDELRESAGRLGVELQTLEFGGSSSTGSQSREALEAKPDGGLGGLRYREHENQTDIGSAIRTAIASMPPTVVANVLVMSDGNDNSGSDPAVAARGVKISTMPLPVRTEPEVQLTDVIAPTTVRRGEPFYVEVVVSSNVDGEGYVDLYRGDVRIGDGNDKPIKIVKGENRFRFRQSVEGRRQETFSARVRGPGDTLLGNNEASAVVYAAGRPRVLWIDADVAETDSLRWALDEQSIDVEVRPVEGVPRDLTELQGYECLVLSNVPATAMSMRQMDLIRLYVQQLGGGLIMLGGDQAFGLGGYYRTRIEEILPVRSNFEKEREKPSLAMMLVIDKSGSMGGEKIELAKDAAIAAAELLGPRDSLGVVAFDGEPYLVAEMTSATNRGSIVDAISTIDASGGTNMYPAMTMAYEQLTSSQAKLKHVIMMTDGVSAEGDFQGAADEMAASRITLSTVALGQGASEDLLEELAMIGGGRYYFCDDPSAVPQVFAKETVEAGQSAINELPFIAQPVRPTDVLRGIEMDLSPMLLGYVVTRPKPTAEFILATEAGDPLLCWWRYGLGMSVAFTSDAKNRWAGEWLAWPDFGTFWAKIIRHAMRKQDASGLTLDVQKRGDVSIITLDAVDPLGNFMMDMPATLAVIDPALGQSKVALKPTGPGRYEATVPTGDRGTYYFDAAVGDGPSGGPVDGAMRISRGLTVGYPDELRLLPLGERALRRIATRGGGKYYAQADFDDLLRPDGRTARRPMPLWPALLIAALVIFVADVALRRVEFSSPRVGKR